MKPEERTTFVNESVRHYIADVGHWSPSDIDWVRMTGFGDGGKLGVGFTCDGRLVMLRRNEDTGRKIEAATVRQALDTLLEAAKIEELIEDGADVTWDSGTQSKWMKMLCDELAE